MSVIPSTTSYFQMTMNALGYGPVQTHSFMKGTITVYDQTKKSVVSIHSVQEFGKAVEYIMINENTLTFNPEIDFSKGTEITILNGEKENIFLIHIKKKDVVQKWHVDTDKVIELPWARNAYEAKRDK